MKRMMTQRLVWNFECATTKPLDFSTINPTEKTDIKWEQRYFWPQNEIIVLNHCPKELLKLSLYDQKIKEDEYYLLADSDHNIKKRRNELLLKPVLNRKKTVLGYGSKIILAPDRHGDLETECETISKRALDEAVVIQVKKEAFIFKCPTTPSIKIELSRLEVLNTIYHSVCIEGRSLQIVETISQHLLKKQVSCDYVCFLKSISS